MIYEIMSTIIVLGKVVCTLLILESKRYMNYLFIYILQRKEI